MAKKIVGGDMQPSAITEQASQLLDNERANQHGDHRVGFHKAALMMSAVLGVEVKPYQAALCMACIKMSRASMNPENNDNYIDLAGYAGIAGALAHTARETDK